MVSLLIKVFQFETSRYMVYNLKQKKLKLGCVVDLFTEYI